MIIWTLILIRLLVMSYQQSKTVRSVNQRRFNILLFQILQKQSNNRLFQWYQRVRKISNKRRRSKLFRKGTRSKRLIQIPITKDNQVATSSSSIVSNEAFLKRTIYLWQENNQYSKVEVFDDRKRKLGEMEPIGQQFYVMRGNFDPYVHSVVLQMHVSKNVVNRFFTGNDIRPCMVMLGESRYSFAFDQNHTVGLVEYCRVISVNR
ncbi:hypothetical protein NAEGRDRAFT_80152 [Naegleria gruberi]|uniref:Uncharacterized protein n=1 Tax=Naegleria gruberi TaxID=5762 RepID=D2VJ34_NAEGR|nr:uncharacterized protein NAEGRDRAFT_80152 [Naegleria gruberi]EFC43208.1 hypothetical protein NAEGRDRAFT_80152 [Naegleria gruberi]|eukprot:XP_002675952.1 hypothetical protein NAEGRDRAFT_80152 [Naegleria gruberi strain NEG-M]